jgi:acyl-homoserine lactone acylase PvdQ
VNVVGHGDYVGWSATRGDQTTVTVFVDNFGR